MTGHELRRERTSFYQNVCSKERYCRVLVFKIPFLFSSPFKHIIRYGVGLNVHIQDLKGFLQNIGISITCVLPRKLQNINPIFQLFVSIKGQILVRMVLQGIHIRMLFTKFGPVAVEKMNILRLKSRYTTTGTKLWPGKLTCTLSPCMKRPQKHIISK